MIKCKLTVLIAGMVSVPASAQFVCQQSLSCSGSSSAALTVSNSNTTTGSFALFARSSTGFGLNASSAGGNGVQGVSSGSSSMFAGVMGQTSACGAIGVAGRSTTTTGGCVGYGVYGDTANGSYSGYFIGDVDIWGSLWVDGTKNFKIPYPSDPARTLMHAGMESPELLTMYDGLVTLGVGGSAVVELPVWFSALNTAFEYQLSTIDAYAPVFVSKEIANHKFEISGGVQGMQIAWQVTAVRNDVYSVAHPMVVEIAKAPSEREAYRARKRGELSVNSFPLTSEAREASVFCAPAAWAPGLHGGSSVP